MFFLWLSATCSSAVLEQVAVGQAPVTFGLVFSLNLESTRPPTSDTSEPKHQANLQKEENFIEVVNEGIKESSRRKVVQAPSQSIEVDNHKALDSVKLLDPHRVVRELVGPTFNLMDHRCRGEGRGQKSLP